MHMQSERSARWIVPVAAVAVSAILVLLVQSWVGPDTAVGDATVARSESPTSDAAATATVDGGGPQPAIDEVVGAERFIGGTGGSGVALRLGCADDMQLPGSWPEGASVVIFEVGAGECDGWLHVGDANVASWVRVEYLTDVPPQVASSPAPPSVTTASAPSITAQAPPAPAPSSPPSPLAAAPRIVFTFRALDGRDMELASIDGLATILGGSTTGFAYLGLVSSSRTHPDSICNPSGRYGSRTSLQSMRNPDGPFGISAGGPVHQPYHDSSDSAYNTNAISPPKVFLNGNPIAHIGVSGLPASIHPDMLFAALGC